MNRMELIHSVIVAAVLWLGLMGMPGALLAQTCPSTSPLVSYWPANDDANDVVGGNDGTVQNGAGFADGQVSRAFDLDGVDDYISVSHDPSLNLGTGEFTIAVWINPSTITSYRLILHKRDGSVDKELELRIGQSAGDGRLFFLTGDAASYSQVVSSSSIEPDRYTHVAIVRQANKVMLYLDGELDNFVLGGPHNISSSSELYIGRAHQGGGYFAGMIDEVQIMRHAITSSEVAAIYRADCSRSSCGCK
ncbi:MAG: LamG domain-containing protein [Proteobacteria bacterium]|nr:LamG domain-containing protein [Pseudomonadota bacterium]